MKKITILASVLLVLAVAFSACAPVVSPNEAAQTSAPEQKPMETTAPAEAAPAEEAPAFKAAMVTDLGGLAASEESKGFSDLGWDALLKASEEYGFEVTLVESKELADLEPNMTKLADEGYNYIVGVGFLFTDAMNAVAPKYPDTHFAIVDSVVDSPNVDSLVFTEEEGSFLVGAMAAGMSKSGTIGFIGGMEVPLIEKFEAGYIAGAKSINPDIKVLSNYTGNFNDVASGKEASLVQFNQGADVIYAAAGACGLGTIEAAAEQGFWAIGVDTDQDGYAPGHVLTSMLKHVEVAVYESVVADYEGKFTGGVKVFDLAVGGVGYSEMKYTKDQVPAELINKVDVLSAAIVADKIVVPTTRDEANAFVLPPL